ncbi:hypothetical protein [Aeromicrobium sp. Sec7.5]|uniref:hypothetical protein n=1 Tax=Aeromicrobium sp. Sec7.5 TaxID=3121276 RepID=UPI002FE4AF4E
MQFLIGVPMVCCIAAVAVLAVLGKVVGRPWAWLRGRGAAPAESAMPPPARYDVPANHTPQAAAR